MTKWARMRKRKQRRKAEEEISKEHTFEENEIKPSKPKEASDNTRRSEKPQKLETPKPISILYQIPRYVYLVVIFTLLSGVFFPLITTGADKAVNFVFGGVAILLVGLAGGILLYKTATSEKKRGIFLVVGAALMGISLTLIFLIQDLWAQQFFRG